MLLMDYTYIGGEDLTNYAKKAIWNLFRAYIDAHSQIAIDEYPRYGVQAISILQYQCANMTFSEKIRYNRLFHNVLHKGGESAINYIYISE